MTNTDIITKTLTNMRKQNVKNFVYDEKECLKKLEGYGKRFGFSEPYDYSEIYSFINNNAIALLLMKDPNKQNIHEDVVFNYLKDIFPNFKNLPKNSKSIINGEVLDYNKTRHSKTKT